MKLIRKNRTYFPIYLVFFLCFTYINNLAQSPGNTQSGNNEFEDTSSFTEIALNFDTSEHMSNLIDSNIMYTDEMLEFFIEEKQEIEQNVESWMTDNAYFQDLLIEKHVSEEQVENEPEVEGWMIDADYWK